MIAMIGKSVQQDFTAGEDVYRCASGHYSVVTRHRTLNTFTDLVPGN